MASPKSTAHQRLTDTLLDLAQLGHAHWLFGNIYEAVVKIPDRLSAPPNDPDTVGRPTSLLAPGSPVRYYFPAGPLTVAATLAALIAGRDTTDRDTNGATRSRWLRIAAASSLAGAATTGYLIATVNLKLFFGTQPPPPAERAALIRTWYRLNVVRTATTGAALFACYRARHPKPDTPNSDEAR